MKNMTIEHFTTNETFMNEFITLANESYENYGSYEDVYYGYEGKMTDDEIYELLNYCEDNKLLEY